MSLTGTFLGLTVAAFLQWEKLLAFLQAIRVEVPVGQRLVTDESLTRTRQEAMASDLSEIERGF